MSNGIYDEEDMFPVPRVLFFQMRDALRFYAREGNYQPWRGGEWPVIRDGGDRAHNALMKLEQMWLDHDQYLFEKSLEDRR